MKFEDLLTLVRSLPWFDLPMLVQLTDERRPSLIGQIHRFANAGKIVPLRRGMYVLGEQYRQVAVEPAELAGVIYPPSYLSGVWALSHYGLIPESVRIFTSVTTRTPKRFGNVFGEFAYRNLKQSLFFGFSAVQIGGRKVFLASPEKALLDHFHLETGEWTAPRMREMRFVRGGMLEMNKLAAMVRRIAKPRLTRAFETWEQVTREETAGEIVL